MGQVKVALALRSHFFKFEELEPPTSTDLGAGHFHLTHQVQKGRALPRRGDDREWSVSVLSA